ncbi:MAG TPA: DoxX family protein [Fibrobacteria bacterium]|nr:DoxX family protein [Fibrobacteria bacterium]
MEILTRLFDPRTTAPRSTLWIRLMTGSVFVWEGVIKFVFVNQGVGRFTKLGMPVPHVLAPSIATLEIVGGLLLIAGLLTRPLALVFIGQMIVAVLSTKISLFLGTYPLAYPPVPPIKGFWAVLHETRSDWAQIATCIFLLLEGPGAWSLDAWRANQGGTPTLQRA